MNTSTLPELGATKHMLCLGNAQNLSFIKDESIHLVITSPPYWSLKRYNEHPEQFGHIRDYEDFLSQIEKVGREVYRILAPGGRLVCVVGDVCLSRKENGRHVVVPLHADICVQCRKIGFDNLNPIIWHKISNASYEVTNGSKFLGKPYEPNAIIKNDIEFILMQRKSGGYRKPTEAMRDASRISKPDFNKWFQQFWTLTGASTREHPAPFPLELANRLVRMFSFVGDTVLDPFAGTGTTLVAALKADRNSIGVEIDPHYFNMAKARLETENTSLFGQASIEFVNSNSRLAEKSPTYLKKHSRAKRKI
ncbi:MAG: site-specific DNA-methyltransferase [Methylacidiphilales bacterium]|nr:site-specific DNA-methyltransferase [Candidatus Methylacidiphilales bacterium]